MRTNQPLIFAISMSSPAATAAFTWSTSPDITASRSKLTTPKLYYVGIKKGVILQDLLLCYNVL